MLIFIPFGQKQQNQISLIQNPHMKSKSNPFVPDMSKAIDKSLCFLKSAFIIPILTETLPEIKEVNHCSCAKYKAEINVWHLTSQGYVYFPTLIVCKVSLHLRGKFYCGFSTITFIQVYGNLADYKCRKVYISLTNKEIKIGIYFCTYVNQFA